MALMRPCLGQQKGSQGKANASNHRSHSAVVGLTCSADQQYQWSSAELMQCIRTEPRQPCDVPIGWRETENSPAAVRVLCISLVCVSVLGLSLDLTMEQK